MKQQCPMVFIYMSWATLIGGLAFFFVRADYVSLLAWMIVAPLAMGAYLRFFPAISRYIGYGSVDDQPAQEVSPASVKVMLYTALGCPFCPVMERRLVKLQAEMGFDLEEVDVTLKPGLLIAKGIRAVPVVEVGEQQIVGHTTSNQLTTLIRNSLPASR